MPGVSPMSSRWRRSSPWPRTALMIAHCPAFKVSSVGSSFGSCSRPADLSSAGAPLERPPSPGAPSSRSTPPLPSSAFAASLLSCVMQTSSPALTFNCLSLRVTGASARTSSRTAEKYPSPRELRSGKFLVPNGKTPRAEREVPRPASYRAESSSSMRRSSFCTLCSVLGPMTLRATCLMAERPFSIAMGMPTMRRIS